MDELDLVSHVVQWREDNKWRLVVKDDVAAEALGGHIADEADWVAIDHDAPWQIHGGAHYVIGQIVDGMPSRVTVNGGIPVEVHRVGRIWGASYEFEIVQRTVTFGGPDRDAALASSVTFTWPADPAKLPRRSSAEDRAAWPAATVANLPDTAIGRLLRPVIRDLEATAGGLLQFGHYPGTSDPDLVYLSDSSGAGTGVAPLWADDGIGGEEQVANAVQEAAIEALWGEGKPPVWPVCPDHPGTHPLSVGRDGDALAWICPMSENPMSENVVARVGELGSTAIAAPRR